MRTEKKQQLAQRRHWRVRKKVYGTRERPRMSVCFTNKNIHVQFIDDDTGVTLAAASTTSKATPDRDKLAANVAGAKVIGKLAAETALAKGIKTVVFDRGGARYHRGEIKGKGKGDKPVLVLGKLATLADEAREAGLKF
jgi:large subunit ribosomal protein L18